jgi:hypothetical protein
MVKDSKDFYVFVKDNNLQWIFNFLLEGFDIMGEQGKQSQQNAIYERLMANIKKGLVNEEERALDVFAGVVNPVVAALSVFCEALDEYLEYSSVEDDKIVDGIYH